MTQRDDLISNIFESMNAVKRSMHGRMHAIIGDSPISRSQLELLFSLKQLQPVTSKKLAASMQLTPGAISQLLDGLYEEGLITRETDSSDRRVQILRVSTKGTSQMRLMEKKRHELFKSILDELTDDELKLLLQVQQKMVSRINTIAKTNQQKEQK